MDRDLDVRRNALEGRITERADVVDRAAKASARWCGWTAFIRSSGRIHDDCSTR
jgi:hypothetical protein